MSVIDVPLPHSVHVLTGADEMPRAAATAGTGRWTTPGAEVTACHEPDGALRVALGAPGPYGLSKVALRWRHHPGGRRPALVLGDAWERSYGELQWRGIQPERPLPWYWLGTDPSAGTTAGFGVRTRAGALCCWTVDEDGTTLWLDVRSGGLPVQPGDRELAAATVVGVATGDGTTPYAALETLCAAMSPDPLLPDEPVVGCNNWYYAYGKDFGPEAVLRDAALVAEFARDHAVRPFCVIDDGWTEGGGTAPGGPWDTGLPGRGLGDRTRTSAEVLVALYCTVAEAAGDALVIGCNTIGHLAAGLVQVQRTGDDTSGRHWERTRRMGVNTLAFRLAQHDRFYAVDADCVPCTLATDWALNRRFLDLVARSGTALFISVDPAARTPQADADLTAAVRLALDGGQPGGIEPLDWLDTTAPRRWRAGGQDLAYGWSQPWGAWPPLPL